MWYMIRNLRCTVTIDLVLANSKTQNAFLFTVNAIFRHDYPLAVEPGSTPRPLVQKKTWRDSLLIDMLLSTVSILVVAQSSSEIPEGLMDNLYYVRVVMVTGLFIESFVYRCWCFRCQFRIEWRNDNSTLPCLFLKGVGGITVL